MILEKQIQFTDSFNPSTGEKIGSVPLNAREDVSKAIVLARQAQKSWGRLPVKKRVRSLRPVLNHLLENRRHIVEVVSEDNGKTRTDALVTEVFASILACDYYLKNASRFLRSRRLRPGSMALMNKRSRIHRVPFGVVGVISPWNYPFSIPFAEIIMALAAGNAVLLKVASETLQVGRLLNDVMLNAELPPHLFTYLNLPGSIAGDAFLEGGVDKLFFTGSVRVGKYLMKKASETLTPLSLELGGNDAMLVCEDADLERASAGAVWAGFQNAGQSCGGVERIYVHEKVYERFLQMLKERTEALRVGRDRDYSVDMGCMTTAAQVETVREHIRDALEQGAVVYAKSSAPQGLPQFLPAMVLTGVHHDMRVMREETFGPVLGVMCVGDMDRALELANDSNLGLTASVWSRDRSKARILAGKIQAGVVTINDHLMSHGLHETPWGGFKESGIGRTHGRLGFDEMTQPQVIVDDYLWLLKAELWWHPFDRKRYRALDGLMELLYGKCLITKAKGLWALLPVLPRLFGK